MRSVAQSRSSCVTHSGGARRTVVSCVSLARTPMSSSRSHTVARRRGLGGELDADPQALAADLADGVRRSLGAEPFDQRGAQLVGSPLVLAGAQQPQDLEADRAGERVAAERRAVLAGPEHARARRASTPRPRPATMPPPSALPRTYTSGCTPSCSHANVRPVRPEPGLDLVGDQQHAALGAELTGAPQVALGRHDDARPRPGSARPGTPRRRGRRARPRARRRRRRARSRTPA